MNKNFFYFFLLLSLLLFSCSKKNENSSRPSTGMINSISVVINDQLWNGIIGDSIRNKFANPVEGLSKEEPQFDVNQYPIDVMEGFVTKNRTIIVVKLGKEDSFAIKKNQYATPQNVIHITGTTLSNLLDIIEKKAPQIIKTIQEGEIKAHQLLLSDSISNSKAIEKQFKISLNIPRQYVDVIKNDSFVWLKKEFPSGSTSLLITTLPITSINPEGDVLEKIVTIHDSIAGLYIKSKESASCLYIDRSYPLYLSKIKLDGKFAFESKGTWRLKDSFMFGAFTNYLIFDAKNKRIIYLEGFCYIPSSEQRDYMHELESIIKSLHIN